jgi:hypothetical protein
MSSIPSTRPERPSTATTKQKKCDHAYYDRVALTSVCDVTGKGCKGYIENCEVNLC